MNIFKDLGIQNLNPPKRLNCHSNTENILKGSKTVQKRQTLKGLKNPLHYPIFIKYRANYWEVSHFHKIKRGEISE